MPRDHGFNGVRHAPEFTERQYAVLVCLCQGDPNKVIGRKLGMTETTVKVHVREIMRKLGVSNRTQVAIAAAHVCSDGAIELVPADFIHGGQAVDISLAMNFRHCVPSAIAPSLRK